MPGGPTTCSVRPPPARPSPASKNGQPKQWSAWKCETTTTSMAVDREAAATQVRQRGGRGLHQHGCVHDEAVPVAPRRGQEVARPEEGELGHDVSARDRKRGHQQRGPRPRRSPARAGAGTASAPGPRRWPAARPCLPARAHAGARHRPASCPRCRSPSASPCPGARSASAPTMISMNSGTPSSATSGRAAVAATPRPAPRRPSGGPRSPGPGAGPPRPPSRLGPPGPARRVRPGLAQRAAAASRCTIRSHASRSSSSGRASARRPSGLSALAADVLGPSTTAPRRCGGPGRAPTIRGVTAPGRRDRAPSTSASERLSLRDGSSLGAESDCHATARRSASVAPDAHGALINSSPPR